MERLWTRAFVLTSLSSLFLYISFYMLVPTMPLYVKALGGLDVHVGLAQGAFTLSAVVFRPLAGALMDRHGRRPFLLAGLALFSLCMYWFGSVEAVALLLWVRFAQGLGWAFGQTASASAVADIVPPARRAEGVGWFGTAMTLAMAVAPMLATWTLEERSFRYVFLLAAGLAALSLAAVIPVRYPSRPPAAPRRLHLLDPATLPVAVAVVMLAFSYSALITFLPLFALSLDVNPGTFFLVYAVALTVSRPLAGPIADRRGEGTVAVPAAALMIAGLLLLSSSTSAAGVLAAAVLHGLGYGAAHPALQAAVLRLAAPERFGGANAAFFTAFDLGLALGAASLGWLADALGYRVLFGAAGAAAALCLATFLAWVNPRLKAQAGRLQRAAG